MARRVSKKTGASAPSKGFKTATGKGRGGVAAGPGSREPQQKPQVVAFNEATVKAINDAGPKGHEVAHINPREERLLKALGGSGEKDPKTNIKSYETTGYEKGVVETSLKLPKEEGRGRLDSTHQVAVLTDPEVEALNTLRWEDKDKGYTSGFGPVITALAEKNDRPFDFVEYKGEKIPTLNDSGSYGSGDSGSSWSGGTYVGGGNTGDSGSSDAVLREQRAFKQRLAKIMENPYIQQREAIKIAWQQIADEKKAKEEEAKKKIAAAEKKERDRIAAIEAKKEAERVAKEQAEQARLDKIEAQRIIAEAEEKERKRIAKEEAEAEAEAERIAEQKRLDEEEAQRIIAEAEAEEAERIEREAEEQAQAEAAYQAKLAEEEAAAIALQEQMAKDEQYIANQDSLDAGGDPGTEDYGDEVLGEDDDIGWGGGEGGPDDGVAEGGDEGGDDTTTTTEPPQTWDDDNDDDPTTGDGAGGDGAGGGGAGGGGTDTTDTDDVETESTSVAEKEKLLEELEKKYAEYGGTDYEKLYHDEFSDDLQEDYSAASKGLDFNFLTSGDRSEFNTAGNTVNDQQDYLGELLEGAELDKLKTQARNYGTAPKRAIKDWYKNQLGGIKDGTIDSLESLDLSDWSDPSENYNPEFFGDKTKRYYDPSKTYFDSELEDPKFYGLDDDVLPEVTEPEPGTTGGDEMIMPDFKTGEPDPVPDLFTDEGNDPMGNNDLGFADDGLEDVVGGGMNFDFGPDSLAPGETAVPDINDNDTRVNNKKKKKRNRGHSGGGGNYAPKPIDPPPEGHRYSYQR